MQTLCQLDVQGAAFVTDLAAFIREEAASGDVAGYARDLAETCWAERVRYDALLGEASEHWSVERMPLVDRNIARIAVCEMVDRPDVPPAVAIDEAVEIAREFGSAESGAFLNGLLDAVRKKLPPRS